MINTMGLATAKTIYGETLRGPMRRTTSELRATCGLSDSR
jgi:hypothetical protein